MVGADRIADSACPSGEEIAQAELMLGNAEERMNGEELMLGSAEGLQCGVELMLSGAVGWLRGAVLLLGEWGRSPSGYEQMLRG